MGIKYYNCMHISSNKKGDFSFKLKYQYCGHGVFQNSENKRNIFGASYLEALKSLDPKKTYRFVGFSNMVRITHCCQRELKEKETFVIF